MGPERRVAGGALGLTLAGALVACAAGTPVPAGDPRPTPMPQAEAARDPRAEACPSGAGCVPGPERPAKAWFLPSFLGSTWTAADQEFRWMPFWGWSRPITK